MYRADSQLGAADDALADTRSPLPATMDLAGARIAVIGLGYVGLPLAVEFGKQRAVLGFDINPDRTRELRQKKDSTLEVTARELHAASKLTFSSDPDLLRELA